MFKHIDTFFATECGQALDAANGTIECNPVAGLLAEAAFSPLHLDGAIPTEVGLEAPSPSDAFMNFAKLAVTHWSEKAIDANSMLEAVLAVSDQYAESLTEGLTLKRLPKPRIRLCANASGFIDNSQYSEEAYAYDEITKMAGGKDAERSLLAIVDPLSERGSSFAVLHPWASILFLQVGTPEWKLYNDVLNWVSGWIFPVFTGATISNFILERFEDGDSDDGLLQSYLDFNYDDTLGEQATEMRSKGLEAGSIIRELGLGQSLEDYRRTWGPRNGTQLEPKTTKATRKRRSAKEQKALSLLTAIEVLQKQKATFAESSGDVYGCPSDCVIAIAANKGYQAQQDIDDLFRESMENGLTVSHLGYTKLDATTPAKLKREIERLKLGIKAYQLLDDFLALCTTEDLK